MFGCYKVFLKNNAMGNINYKVFLKNYALETTSNTGILPPCLNLGLAKDSWTTPKFSRKFFIAPVATHGQSSSDKHKNSKSSIHDSKKFKRKGWYPFWTEGVIVYLGIKFYTVGHAC